VGAGVGDPAVGVAALSLQLPSASPIITHAARASAIGTLKRRKDIESSSGFMSRSPLPFRVAWPVPGLERRQETFGG